jgi:hypothetical protein
MKVGVEVYHHLKNIIQKKHGIGAINVGDDFQQLALTTAFKQGQMNAKTMDWYIATRQLNRTMQ